MIGFQVLKKKTDIASGDEGFVLEVTGPSKSHRVSTNDNHPILETQEITNKTVMVIIY